MMTLYTYPITTNALKLELLINAANIQIERRLVNLIRGEQKSVEFLALNPLGKISLLVDGNQVFCESDALLFYLAKQHRSTLWPAGEEDQGHVLQWLFWQSTVWGPAAETFHHQQIVVPSWGLICDQSALEKKRRHFASACRHLEVHLEQRSKQKRPLFLAADSLTVADLSVAALLLFWRKMALPIDSYPALEHWLIGLQATAWWQQSYQQARAFITQNMHTHDCLQYSATDGESR